MKSPLRLIAESQTETDDLYRLIDESSLGTDEARHFGDQSDPATVLRIIHRRRQLAPEAKEPLRPLPDAMRVQRDVVETPDLVEAPVRGFKSWSTAYVLRLAAFDIVVGTLAVALPALSLNYSSRPAQLITLTLLAGLVWPMAIAVARGYDRKQAGVASDETRSVLRAGLGVLVVAAFSAAWLNAEVLTKLAVVAAPIATAMSIFVRLLARKWLHVRQRAGRNLRRVVVVGGWVAAKQLREQLEVDRNGMRIVGACIPTRDIQHAIELGMPVLGNLNEVPQIVRDFGCDAVAVASDDATRHRYLQRLAWALEGTESELLVDPGLVDVAGSRVHIRFRDGLPLLHVEEPYFTGWRRVIKRVTDVVLASVGLIVCAPVLVAIALVIKLQDGGPVIFRQARLGRSGRTFTMFKFRTMVVHAEARKADLIQWNEGKGGLFKLSHDPRITRLGRFLRSFSLDELPQLINVLLGNMSLVGPRPLLPAEVAAMPSEALRRHLVTPGLTGLWQISGRSDLDWVESMRLDLRYVENWSLSLDLLILWRTAFAVFARRGAW